MRIGIIGAGQIGGTLARRLTSLGHEVAIANSRGPDTLRALAAETGAKAVTASEAARSGEIGYSIGTYHVMFTGPDGKMIMDDGKYSTVWKKQADGSWKLAVDMFNSNTPLPAPPGAKK